MLFTYEGETYQINKHICPSCGHTKIRQYGVTGIEYAGKSLTSNSHLYRCSCQAQYAIGEDAKGLDLTSLVLVTSNAMKLQEFRDFGVTDLQMDKGADLKEVDSDEETVVLYKAMAAGKNRIVEDTSLTIEGFDVGVNIRWLLDNLNIYEGARATWKVFLGVNLGMTVALFSGEIEGHIVKAPPTENKVFGFDNNFRPINSSQTLHQLSILGLKAQYSARKNGVDALLDGEPDKVVEILRIPMWSGKYQNE